MINGCGQAISYRIYIYLVVLIICIQAFVCKRFVIDMSRSR